MAPKDVHPLIHRTSHYVTKRGKRDFVIRLRVLRWEIILDYLGGPSTFRRLLRETEGQSQRRKCDYSEAEGREGLRERY